MSSPSSVPIPIKDLFDRIQDTLSQTWQETGFGHLAIESEKIKADKIRVIVRGSTHYCYVISDEDIKQWKSTDKI